MNKKGLFIAFEGGDKSGKTTQVERAKDKLESLGFNVVCFAEPNEENEPGKRIRQALQRKIGMPLPLKFQRWFVESRLWDIEERIAPALERGDIVLLDRYVGSTLAYGQLGGCTIDQLLGLHEEVCGDKMIWADQNFFIDVPAEEALMRLAKSKGEAEFFEDPEKMRRIRSLYLKVFTEVEPLRSTCVIDGNRSEEEVFKTVWSKIEPLVLKLAA